MITLCQFQISDNICILILLLIGTTSSFLLSAFWDETTIIGGVEHSTWLFVLVFFLSLVDCTSSVLFLPFMAIFRDIYLNSYLIGEGMSGFIPSIVALAQGELDNEQSEILYFINHITSLTLSLKKVILHHLFQDLVAIQLVKMFP